jgi:hypothetical protein
MATSLQTTIQFNVNDFGTSLRSQYQPNVNGTPTFNAGNIAKDTFNNGVVGVGYGLAENLVNRTVPQHFSTFTGSQINFNPFNASAAKVIRGLGQALGCVIDVGDALGNVSQGNNTAAVCNIASCVGGAAGGWGGGALGAVLGDYRGLQGQVSHFPN